jgi:tetratricopeptide (TPR) repeat protein
MKRAAMVIVVLGISVWSFSQNNTKPATGGQTAPPAGQAAAPQGKRPPAAKTQPEFEAYKVAAALTDVAAQDKAADDFATKFPDSELRAVIFKQVMHGYQQANNADKVMDAAKKVLAYDADDPEALLGAAQVLAERTRDTDLDRDQRLAEARKDAERALVTVDTDIPTAGVPQDRLDAYKGFLRSDAYSIIGTLDYNNKAWADAETNLRKSIDALPQQPDPVAVLRLSIALDNEKKYPEALRYADQAVQLTKEDTVAGKAARSEKDRLTQLNSGTAPGQNPAPPK